MDSKQHSTNVVKVYENLPKIQNFIQFMYEEVDEEHNIKNVAFEGSREIQMNFSDCSFENVIFRRCIFESTQLMGCSFRNVLFENCSFVACDFSDSWFSHVAFVNSSLQGANFTSSRMLHAELLRCNLRYCNFTACKIEDCLVENSDASNGFFAQCTLKEVLFTDTKFVCAEFFHTNLCGMDLSNCDIRGIALSQEAKEISGAIVNVYQAADLAKLMGIIIKEEN